MNGYTAMFPDGSSYAAIVFAKEGKIQRITNHRAKKMDVPPGTVLVGFGGEAFAPLPTYDEALENALANKPDHIHLPNGFEHTVTMTV